MNLTMHIDKSEQEIHNAKVSELSTKSKQMELTLTAVENKIQKTDVNFGLFINEFNCDESDNAYRQID